MSKNIRVYSTSTVYTEHWLNDEDSERVCKYAEENKCSYTDAVEQLWHKHEIDVWNCYNEDYEWSNFSIKDTEVDENDDEEDE